MRKSIILDHPMLSDSAETGRLECRMLRNEHYCIFCLRKKLRKFCAFLTDYFYSQFFLLGNLRELTTQLKAEGIQDPPNAPQDQQRVFIGTSPTFW